MRLKAGKYNYLLEGIHQVISVGIRSGSIFFWLQCIRQEEMQQLINRKSEEDISEGLPAYYTHNGAYLTIYPRPNKAYMMAIQATKIIEI